MIFAADPMSERWTKVRLVRALGRNTTLRVRYKKQSISVTAKQYTGAIAGKASIAGDQADAWAKGTDVAPPYLVKSKLTPAVAARIVAPPPYYPADAYQRASFWMGPGGATSPLHKDGADAFVNQLLGRKRLLLFSPTDVGKLALLPAGRKGHRSRGETIKEWHKAAGKGKTIGDTSLNWSRHGVFTPYQFMDDLRSQHPALRNVKMHVIDLRAGEMLYLPAGWGHCEHNFGKFSATMEFMLHGKDGRGARIWDP